MVDANDDQRRPNQAAVVPGWINPCDDEVAGGRSTRKGRDQGCSGRKAGCAAAPKNLFEACDKYLEAKEATANTTRVVEFERERLEVVKRYLGDIVCPQSPARRSKDFRRNAASTEPAIVRSTWTSARCGVS